MRNKKILKIGLSLLIALAFILPSSAIMAGQPRLVHPDEEGYADERQNNPTVEEQKAMSEGFMQIGGAIDEAMNPVILQDLAIISEIGALLFENPAGQMITMLTGETDPVEDFYGPWMKIVNPGPGEDLVEPELEIYNWDPTNCEVVYETSFEDNAANYMEWAQIDGDCGDPGTYYDSWSWSDARACDGDHSFKNTMYDEYKNMQDDYFYMTQGVDISEYSTVTVHFDTFVAGEYATWYSDYWAGDLYSPLDYLEFGIIDSGTMYFIDNGDGQIFCDSAGYIYPGNFYFFDTSIPLYSVDDPGYDGMDYTQKAEKIDSCPGWWHVWLDLPVSILSTPEEFGIWFGFHSDKERVYEGAYVDNIIIEGCIPDGEKIYQGHSQQWLTIPEGVTYFEFPLIWDDVVPGSYKAIAKLKNEGDYDDWIEIYFDIADNLDCQIVDMFVEDDFTGEIIPDGGIMHYTADAHIPFTYHNAGNVPVGDVAVKASGYKIVEETLFEDDFEGMNNWVYFYEDYPLYTTTDFAWSGSKSLAFNNPDTMHYDNDGFYVGYSQAGFSMEGVEECQLDLYYKAKLADSGEQFVICMLTYQYILGYYLLLNGPMDDTGWVGPMQPQCQYASIDFKYQFDRISNYGYFLDANGHQTYDTGIGFWLETDDHGVFYDGPDGQETDWSGVYIDDISFTAKTVGEKVWEDTMVIPGPCQPSETCSNQFTWEDVPYSNYKVCVEAICEGDINEGNDQMCSTFIVLEDLEKASKPEFADYTECTDEAWCISDVIGAGDHYALATNCDTNEVPHGVNDYIGLAYADDECCVSALDITHLTIGGSGSSEAVFEDDFEAGAGAWTIYDGDGNPANWEFGSTIPGACVDGGATGSWFWIDDDAAGSGASPSTDNEIISPVFDASGAAGCELTFNGDFQDMAGDGELTISAYDGAMWHVVAVFTDDVGGFDGMTPIDISVIDGVSTAQIKFHYTDDGGWAWGALIDDVVVESSAAASLATVTLINEGFEGGVPPIGWTTTGWLDSLYGSAHGGTHWAYSWAYGDVMDTPVLNFLDDTELRFWYMAESSGHPMDLEVYCDATLVFSNYGYIHTSYIEAVVDLSAFDNGAHIIEFVGLTSDYYGQCLDDVLVTTEEAGPVGDPIPIEFNYQCDLYDPYMEVILEVAGINIGAQTLTLVMSDDYGDGWDYGHFMDAWVNDVKVLDGVYCSGLETIETFTAVEGDLIKICYYGAASSWPEEHSWQLFSPEGFVLFQDGQGGVIPESTCYGPVTVGTCAGCPDQECLMPNDMTEWQTVCVMTGNTPGIMFNFVDDLADYLEPGDTHMFIRFRLDTSILEGYSGYPGIGWHLHDILIENLFPVVFPGDVPDFYEDFEDGNMINEDSGLIWCTECLVGGEYWEESGAHMWGQVLPNQCVDNAFIWDTEIEDAYEAYLSGMWSYDIGADAVLTFELSADGGNTWYIIAEVEGAASSGHGAIPCADPFDLTPWAGSSILVRVRIISCTAGFVNVSDLVISGKQDRVAPTATISLSGNMIGPGLYAGPVTVTIDAVDDTGMGEIHYILDGSESVVSGDQAKFTVSTDGSHSVEFWAIDATGNEGAHGSTGFTIDASAPTVAITAPEPGLYLFGNKLMGMAKPIIIGAFTIEATADDGQGIAVVQFMLNGEIIGEDTEAPFDTYCAVKNMGAGTIKVVAKDGVGNTAEDTLDVTYYKFL